MTRLLFTSLSIILVLSLPESAFSGQDDLDSASLQQAQVYLDSLWTIFDVVKTDEDLARQRMHAFLDAWAEEGRKELANTPRDGMTELCDEVFNAAFTPRFPHDRFFEATSPGLTKTSQGMYIVVSDSVRCTVVTDTFVWDTLASRTFRDLNTIGRILTHIAFKKWRPRVRSAYKILYLSEVRYAAFQAFLNGHMDLRDYGRKISENDERFAWVGSFFPICPGHWGDYYGLLTDSAVGRFLFDLSQSKVILSVSDGCFSGHSEVLIKDDDTWKMDYSYDYSIE
ncbi:MAG: hypothetical protein WC824_03575 [Bacteroidota bacterium]